LFCVEREAAQHFLEGLRLFEHGCGFVFDSATLVGSIPYAIACLGGMGN
jgi:hypothetical protein